MENQDPVGMIILYVLMGSLTAVFTVACAGCCAFLVKKFWKELRK